MKIKTLEKLEDTIDNDFAWRKKELETIRIELKSATGLKKKTLIRSGVTLLYAHWEGFIRNISNYYLIYICFKKIPVKYLKTNFIIFKYYNEINTIKNGKSQTLQIDFINKLYAEEHEVFFVKYRDEEGKRFINTNSNLNYKLFKQIIEILGLENRYSTYENLIDHKLLSYRNEIAHGEFDKYDSYDFEEIYKSMIIIMEDYKDQIVVAASEKKFLKPLYQEEYMFSI
ncbi:MAE_28990/MAE_18760 family HEPN-like nuclease [Lysinibacillus fusiformis]|uniref:MAE_28990/MAE_18760 family HEPN-like nuclease n=1 Tax=Lysinibacillus fusiformis TaxID=28031 RepID=UPI003CFF89D2